MAGEWSRTTLGAIAAKDGFGLVDGPFGSNLPASCYTEGGIPVIRGSNLSLGTSRFRTDEFVFVSHDTAQRLARSLCRPLDIVFTKKGTLGQTGLVPEAGPYDLYLLSSNQMKLTVNRTLADPLFVYYFVSSHESTERIIRDSEATGVPKTNVTYLRDFPIALPPLPEQRAIAHILGTLDDKIELNRRMSETLEAMARALFKSWFVDFDPVRAKAEGRARQDGERSGKPRKPLDVASDLPWPKAEAGAGAEGDPGLPKQIADLFPNRFEESDLGEIPEGWGVGRFGGVVANLRDQENPLESPDVLFQHFSIPAFDEGQWPKSERGEAIKSLKSRVSPGVILLSKLNPEIERVWLVDVALTDRAVCSTEFLVLQPRPPFARSYAYCLARSPLFRQQIEGLVTGTSKSHQRAQVDSILNLETVLPPTPVAAAFDGVAAQWLHRTLACRRESRTLAALRDTLLPKLISGDVRVKDAEGFAQKALPA
jgi:type I restriction enzyme S subunit